MLRTEGLPYAVSLGVAAYLAALAQNRTAFLSTQSGIMLRSALTTAIYEHALRLTPVGREGLTSGEVTNLVAVDTQKLFDVMVELHNLWSCPVLVIVVSALLWIGMGPELCVGVVVLILFLPIIQRLVERMLTIRKQRSKLTDHRINMLTAMLQGIRVTKLNHYESKVEESVNSLRNQEMQLLRRELRLWGFVLSAAVISPLLAFGLAISFYALVSDSNIIAPSDAFSALLLFSILRFPINMTARVVGRLAQALDAARRISDFLARDIRPVNDIIATENMDSGSARIELRNGSFAIEPNNGLLDVNETSRADAVAISSSPQEGEASSHRTVSPFTLRNLSLEVPKAQLVAVIGSVGSGKTFLLRALLGEVPPLPSTEHMSLKGTIAYAAQQPFILNATLRDNILFGSEYDELRYDNVIDACCLQPDIARLGKALDFTGTHCQLFMLIALDG
jgi:ABC-type multidrug transport system fused ATPase/permease subunit